MSRFTEKNVPDNLYVSVRYDTRCRNPFSPHKWRTTCLLKRKTTHEVVAYGMSECGPMDNPNRKVGRAIAVGRALKYYCENFAHKHVPEDDSVLASMPYAFDHAANSA